MAGVIEQRDAVRAASYVRMSTEHQRYSVYNQADGIAAYASEHNLDLVKTYADEGRSGLTIKGRPGLKRLIADVQTRPVGFEVLLVYDVSRWGRFQDTDESAFYEFLCRSNGVRVVYCAEPFDNDGSPLSTILKSVKRAMAAEFSRELSDKVFKGQCRVVRLGFRQGGAAGFGLRRQVVDASGAGKAILKPGERKSVQSDRCILVPGPQEEVATVQRIFKLFLAGAGETAIAERLNQEGKLTERGVQWTNQVIHRILTNEKYLGHNVFNRRSRKLKRPTVCNPPETWVRADDVYEPLVSSKTFARAQALIGKRKNARRYSDLELMGALKRLHREVGFISEGLLRERYDMPSGNTYRRRFGDLHQAFQLAGLKPFRDYGFLGLIAATRALRPTLIGEVMEGFEAAGASVELRPPGNLLTVDKAVSVAVHVATWSATRNGHDKWTVRTVRWAQADVTLVIRLDPGTRGPLDYFILPKAAATGDLVNLNRRRIAQLDEYRFDDLTALYALVTRSRQGGEAAGPLAADLRPWA
jgi:DNA invertase Pin-like site-specific DNA recombinase